MELLEVDPPFKLGPAARDFVAGAVAGAFAITVSQPLDTVRVRLQQFATGADGVPHSTISVLRSMLAKEGIMSPWKGLTYPLLFASLQSALLFQVYGWTLRQMMADDDATPQSQDASSSSASSGFAASAPPSAAAGGQASRAASSSQPTAGAPIGHGSVALERQAAAGASPPLAAPAPRPRPELGLGLPPHWLPGAASASLGPASAGTGPSQGLQQQQHHHPHHPHHHHHAHYGHGHGYSHGHEWGPQGRTERGEGAERIPTALQGGVAGAVAGFAQVFLWSPVELLKLRLQLQTASPGGAGYLNPVAMATRIVRHEGVPGLYRGFTLTVVRDIPSFALYFYMYHEIAGRLSPGVHPEDAPASTQVVAGGVAGVLAWLPIYPLDLIKTRVQATCGTSLQGAGRSASREGWYHHARQLYAEGGARAFLRGASPTLVRAFVMDSASFLGYTYMLKALPQ